MCAGATDQQKCEKNDACYFHKVYCRLTKKAEPPPTRDVNRDSGTASANGGWLRRLVRPHVVSQSHREYNARKLQRNGQCILPPRTPTQYLHQRENSDAHRCKCEIKQCQESAFASELRRELDAYKPHKTKTSAHREAAPLWNTSDNEDTGGCRQAHAQMATASGKLGNRQEAVVYASLSLLTTAQVVAHK